MASIRIKNIGPIHDTGVIPLTHIMLIIGEQSTGKSTFLKVLCHCRWFEKQVMIGNYENLERFTINDFVAPLKAFHNLSDQYFENNGFLIDYDGDVIHIACTRKKLEITEKRHIVVARYNSKLCYIPAERNLLSAIPSLDAKYRSSTYNSMFNAVIEFDEANGGFTTDSPLRLSFADNMEYYHEGQSDYVRLTDKKVRPLLLEHTSSGIQSALPLNVMVHYLCATAGNQARRSPSDIRKDSSRGFGDRNSANRLNWYNFPQLFIEEPEQHLYPNAQAKLVRDILSQFSLAKKKTGIPGYVVITTHSPYILTQLNVMLKARQAYRTNDAMARNIIPEACVFPFSYYSAYFLNREGTLRNMMDNRTKMIMGEFLDSVSDEVEEQMNGLNDIIYG